MTTSVNLVVADINQHRSPIQLSLMAPFYRLTLLIFACIAYWGGTSGVSRAMATVENETQPLTNTHNSTLVDVERSDLLWQMAQSPPEKSPTPDAQKKPEPKKSSFRLPSKVLLLGIGALIVTGGAILILIRLINVPPEEEGTVVDIEAQTVTPASSPLPQTQPSPVTTLSPGEMQTAPTVLQPNQPPSSVTQQNGYREPLQVSMPDQPSEKPVGVNSPVTDTVNLPQLPYGSKLDPQEQWIQDLKHTNPDIRSHAIWELAQKGDSRAIQPLLELLIYSDSNERSLVLAALSEIGTRTLKPLSRALSLSLQDDNAEVRKNAIRDLIRIYDFATQMNQILQRAIDDPDPEVQDMAKWATNRLSRLRSISKSDEPPI